MNSQEDKRERETRERGRVCCVFVCGRCVSSCVGVGTLAKDVCRLCTQTFLPLFVLLCGDSLPPRPSPSLNLSISIYRTIFLSTRVQTASLVVLSRPFVSCQYSGWKEKSQNTLTCSEEEIASGRRQWERKTRPPTQGVAVGVRTVNAQPLTKQLLPKCLQMGNGLRRSSWSLRRLPPPQQREGKRHVHEGASSSTGTSTKGRSFT